jgi:phage/plasmid-associated DNA primase
MGDYKATVPVTLVTQKRNNIGGTSSEIVQLMGVRYAVMQEPTKGDKINEGIMKEITGGDPIQGRALFKETVTFIPQFKLVVCTNTLFDIKSNDDGTWRRIRVCDFMSKFLEKPYEDEDKFPKSEYPYQYPIDKRIDEKFEKWAPVLMSILVDMVYKNNGIVKDCSIVLGSSDQYREGQDYLAEFAKEKIMKSNGGSIKKKKMVYY